jgi:hypothetical protein
MIPKVIAPAAPAAAQPAEPGSAPASPNVEPERVTPNNPTGIVF